MRNAGKIAEKMRGKNGSNAGEMPEELRGALWTHASYGLLWQFVFRLTAESLNSVKRPFLGDPVNMAFSLKINRFLASFQQI